MMRRRSDWQSDLRIRDILSLLDIVRDIDRD